MDPGRTREAGGIHGRAGTGVEMGEREGEVCCYGEEGFGRDRGVEEGYGLIECEYLRLEDGISNDGVWDVYMRRIK